MTGYERRFFPFEREDARQESAIVNIKIGVYRGSRMCILVSESMH